MFYHKNIILMSKWVFLKSDLKLALCVKSPHLLLLGIVHTTCSAWFSLHLEWLTRSLKIQKS